MKKTVLILVNHEVVIYNFRKELVERLINDGYRVVISSPNGKKIKKLIEMGIEHVDVNIKRHGTNPIHEMKLIEYYKQLIKKVNPNVVLTYTIKPNIYGGIASKKQKIPYIANITGLGLSSEKKGLFSSMINNLYNIAFSNAKIVFFQNKANIQHFKNNNINIQNYELLPGSGVNISHFNLLEYPKKETIDFVFISRIMKSKGIEEYLKAAEYIRNKYPYTRFHICGFIDGEYQTQLSDYQERGIINYHGMIDDIREVLQDTHCTIHPSYHEGMSNVLLESAASGRPVIASNIPGCREIFDEGISGFGVEAKNIGDLIRAIEKFLSLSSEEQRMMGINGRKKIIQEFDRQIVVDKYMEIIEKI